MDKITLKADKREVQGRKVKNLRASGLAPANIFGKGLESIAIQVKNEDFEAAYSKAGETSLIDLQVEGKGHPVLISNVQVHPVTSQILHVDFRQVDLKEKITAAVPVEVTGESPAEKSGIGTLVTQLDEIEFEALPTDFPESIQVDISGLSEVDQAIHVKDLSYDKAKLTPQIDEEQIVVKVEPPQKEEVVEVAAPAEGEEAPAEGATAEGGEAAAEGEEASE